MIPEKGLPVLFFTCKKYKESILVNVEQDYKHSFRQNTWLKIKFKNFFSQILIKIGDINWTPLSTEKEFFYTPALRYVLSLGQDILLICQK